MERYDGETQTPLVASTAVPASLADVKIQSGDTKTQTAPIAVPYVVPATTRVSGSVKDASDVYPGS